jgi:hypothetical protein
MSDAACDGRRSAREFEPTLIHLTFSDFVQEARRLAIAGIRFCRVIEAASCKGPGLVFDQGGNYTARGGGWHIGESSFNRDPAGSALAARSPLGRG